MLFINNFLKKGILSVLIFLLSTGIYASPPARVARLTSIQGDVRFLAAGLNDWVSGVLNRPLTTWDRLWVDKDARAELQLGTANLCLGAYTSLAILNLDDRIAQFQLTEGRLNLRVHKIAPNQEYEIDTPNLVFLVRQPGDYRVEVDSEGNTNITTYRGTGEVSGMEFSYAVEEGKSYRFVGGDLSNPQTIQLKKDELDTFCFDRKPKETTRVSNELIGAEDLENYGEWINITSYGEVWTPTQVSADWAPYSMGYWVWIEPWGWTWIDDAPWGFAPCHYGRWIFIEARWVWIPGPVEALPVYAPACVEFVHFNDEIAWFPLGYNEIYFPPYSVSRNYFMNINIGNTMVHSTEMSNIYHHKHMTQETFMNAHVPHAMSGMPLKAFVEAKSPSKVDAAFQESAITQGKFSSTASVSPISQSVLGPGKPLSSPPIKVIDRSTVFKNPLPNAPVPFILKQSKLNEASGKPIDPEEVKKIPVPASVPNPMPNVKTFKALQEEAQKKAAEEEAARKKAALEAEKAAAEEAARAKEAAEKAAQEKAKAKAEQEKVAKDAQSRAAAAAEAVRLKAEEAAQARAAEEAARAKAAQEQEAERERERAAQEAQEKAAAKAAQEAQEKAAEEAEHRAVPAPVPVAPAVPAPAPAAAPAMTAPPNKKDK